MQIKTSATTYDELDTKCAESQEKPVLTRRSVD